MMDSDFLKDGNKKVKIMLAGTSGGGKTTTVCGLIPSLGLKDTSKFDDILPILFLDTEEGAELRLLSLNKDLTNVTVKKISTIDQLTNCYTYCVKNPNVYKTVIIDSMQGLQRKGMNKRVVGKELKPTMITDPVKPQIQDYGFSMGQMEAVVNLFSQLDINLITTIIADEKIKTDLAGNLIGIPKYKLAIPQGQQELIPSLFDIVALILINNKGNRTVVTQQKPKYPFIKDRAFGDLTEGAELTETLILSLINKISEFVKNK